MAEVENLLGKLLFVRRNGEYEVLLGDVAELLDLLKENRKLIIISAADAECSFTRTTTGISVSKGSAIVENFEFSVLFWPFVSFIKDTIRKLSSKILNNLSLNISAMTSL